MSGVPNVMGSSAVPAAPDISPGMGKAKEDAALAEAQRVTDPHDTRNVPQAESEGDKCADADTNDSIAEAREQAGVGAGSLDELTQEQIALLLQQPPG